MLVKLRTVIVIAAAVLPIQALAQEKIAKTVFSITCEVVPETLSYSPDGKLLAVGNSNLNSAKDQPLEKREINVTDNSRIIVEKEVSFHEGGDNLRVFRADEEYKRVSQFYDGQWVWSVRFSPDNKKLISATDEGLRVRILDQKGELQRLQSNEVGVSEFNDVAFSKDGKWLAASHLSNVEIWDFQNGHLMKTLRTGNKSAVCFLSDPQFIVTAEAHNRIKLWNVKTGEILIEHHAEMGPLDDVDVSSDDKYLVVASEASIKCFRLARDGEKFELTELYSKRGGGCVDISSDDRLLVTGSLRGDASIYDLKTGKQIAPLEAGGSRGWVSAACFAPDGKTIAYGGKSDRGPEGKAFLKIIELSN